MSVFISYAMENEPRIAKVIGQLKSKGIVTKNDKIIHASDIFVTGSSIRATVRKAIKDASKVIVVWSGAATDSDWVNYEAGMAEAFGKPIFMVVPKRETLRLPRNLENVQIVELETAAEKE